MGTLLIKLLFISLGFCLFSCKKKVDENYRPEFVGFWYLSDDPYFYFSIKIGKDGYGVYQEIQYGLDTSASIKGYTKANDQKLKIGNLYHFTIIEYPHQIDTAISDTWIPNESFEHGVKANWKMVLKGPHSYRGSGTYYKSHY